MSKPRYDWWGYVKGMIRRYPELCAKEKALHDVSISPNTSGVPGGKGEHSDPTAFAAMRELPPTNARSPRTRMGIRTSWPVSAAAAASTWSTGTATAMPTAASADRKSTGAGRMSGMRKKRKPFMDTILALVISIGFCLLVLVGPMLYELLKIAGILLLVRQIFF